MENNCFYDREMLTDVLSTQKFLTANYNINAMESSGQKVKDTMMSLLDEEQTLQREIFQEMQSRGWYPTENAPCDKIQEVKDEFSCGCCCQ